MTDTAYDRILAALHAHGSTVRTRGHGKASAQCPAHEDRDPSLSVTAIEGQALVYCCHSGCATEDVLTALNLGWPVIGHRRSGRARRARRPARWRQCPRRRQAPTHRRG